MEIEKDLGLPGRPPKFPGETLASLNTKIPKSLREWVDSKNPPASPTDTTIAALSLLKALDELKEAEVRDLRISAALHGQNYDGKDKAKTILRLLRLGLEAEKEARVAAQSSDSTPPVPSQQ